MLEYATHDELLQVLRHALERAGNAELLAKPVQNALVEHAAANYRVLMTMAGELLMAAFERELAQIDEKLFLELFQPRSPRRPAPRRRRAKA